MILRWSQFEACLEELWRKVAWHPHSPQCLALWQWHRAQDRGCLSISGRELARGLWFQGPVTPAGVGDRRAHLEAALQDGKTGGNSLTEISFIWAEPDQLFLIKTHFATCSNASRSRMCAYVQRILGNVPSTGHICKLSTRLRTARQVCRVRLTWGWLSWTVLP